MCCLARAHHMVLLGDDLAGTASAKLGAPKLHTSDCSPVTMFR
jgi:hypothetical protein